MYVDAVLDFATENVVEVDADDMPLPLFFLLLRFDSLSKSLMDSDGTLDHTKFTAETMSLNEDSNESVHLAPRMWSICD